VGRLGAATVTREELSEKVRADVPPRGKVMAPEHLDELLEEWRAEGKHIVFTNGCFDVLHRGHVEYLRFAKEQGDVLLVGINDDESVRRLKGEERPLNALEDRLEVLAALEPVDAVVAFGEDTPKDLVERVSPNVLVKGEDWADKGVVGREWVERHGGKVVLAPLIPGRSTSAILGKARETEGAGS
jgi:D-beta-D-heptose 7-phosphate kinase/D-beta-D-heptose 1-phosphate adenosyltransferase